VADFSFYLPLSLGLNSQEFLVSCLRLQFSVSENFVNMLTGIVNFRDLILHSAVFGFGVSLGMSQAHCRQMLQTKRWSFLKNYSFPKKY